MADNYDRDKIAGLINSYTAPPPVPAKAIGLGSLLAKPDYGAFVPAKPAVDKKAEWDNVARQQDADFRNMEAAQKVKNASAATRERLGFDPGFGAPDAGPVKLSPKASEGLAENNYRMDQIGAAIEQSNRQKTALNSAQFSDAPLQDAPQMNQGQGPVQLIKGGRGPASWHTDEANPIAANTQGLMGDTMVAQDRAASEAEKFGRVKAAAEAGYATEHAQQIELNQQRQQDMSTRQQSIIDTQIAKYQKLVDDNKNQKLDPELYGERDGASKFAVGMAVALGGFLQGMNGGGANPALEYMTTQQNMAIARQKAQLEKAAANEHSQANLLGALREKFGDENTAEAAYRSIYSQRAVAEAEKMSAGVKTQAVQANVAALQADAAKRASDLSLVISDRAQDHVQRNDIMHPDRYIGGAAQPNDKIDTNEISSRVEKAGLTQTREGLKQFQELVSKEDPEAVKALGPTGRSLWKTALEHPIIGMPAFRAMYGERGVALMQQATAISSKFTHDTSGGAFTPAEKSEHEAILFGDGSAASIARTAKKMQLEAASLENNIMAGHSKKVQDEYLNRKFKASQDAEVFNGRIGRTVPLGQYVAPLKDE